MGPRGTANPVSARSGRGQRITGQAFQTGVGAIELAGLAPGAIQDYQPARPLSSRQGTQILGLGPGKEQTRLRRKIQRDRQAAGHRGTGDFEMKIGQTQAGQPSRSNRVKALARMLQQRNAGSIANPGHALAKTERLGLITGPTAPTAGASFGHFTWDGQRIGVRLKMGHVRDSTA